MATLGPAACGESVELPTANDAAAADGAANDAQGALGATDAAPDDAADLPAPGDDAAADSALADAATDVAADAALDSAPDLPPPPQAYPRPEYTTLAETGRFSDQPARVPAEALEFRPTHELWSDGARKRRWLRLPPGTRIDTTEMDHWQFPIGTKVWKEFASPDGVLLETRLIERYGPGPEDYWMGAFVWSADQKEARFAVDGQSNINGTQHDAPAQKLCGSCHRGDKGRLLGFSAIQLSRPGDGATLGALARAGMLSDPPPAGVDFPVPGDATTVAALGYLHANCGHCHNRNGTSWPDTRMVMRLTVSERVPAQSEMWASLVGARLESWRHPTLTLRVAPGEPDKSGVLARMQARGSRDQMPSLATEIVDRAGVDTVTRWVQSLTKSTPDAGP